MRAFRAGKSIKGNVNIWRNEAAHKESTAKEAISMVVSKNDKIE